MEFSEGCQRTESWRKHCSKCVHNRQIKTVSHQICRELGKEHVICQLYVEKYRWVDWELRKPYMLFQCRIQIKGQSEPKWFSFICRASQLRGKRGRRKYLIWSQETCIIYLILNWNVISGKNNGLKSVIIITLHHSWVMFLITKVKSPLFIFQPALWLFLFYISPEGQKQSLN